MKILNIHVYSDPQDSGIKIRFDAIGQVRDEIEMREDLKQLGDEMFHLLARADISQLESDGLTLNATEIDKVVMNTRCNTYFSPIDLKAKLISILSELPNPEHKKTIIELLNNSAPHMEKLAFTPEDKAMIYYRLDANGLQLCEQNDATHQQHSVIYTLTPTPHLALSFMLAVANVITNVMQYDGIYFNANYSEEGLSNTALQQGYNHSVNFMVILLNQVLALPSAPIYQFAMNDLKKIAEPYILYRGTTKQVGFVDLLSAKSCSELLWKPLVDVFLNPDISQEEKGQVIYEMESMYRRENQNDEFDYIVSRAEPKPQIQKKNNHAFFAQAQVEEVLESNKMEFII
jgi:hypothetical protein